MPQILKILKNCNYRGDFVLMNFFIRNSEVQISQKKLEGYLKLAEIIQWGRKSPIHFCQRFMGIEFLDAQKYAFMNSWLKPYNLWCITRNGGKALALDTKIPTPDGFKIMRDLRIGDYVFDENKNPTKIINISDIFTSHDCYSIEFEDEENIISDADHLWTVYENNNNKINIKTSDIFLNFKFDKYSIPLSKNSNYNNFSKKILFIKKIDSVATKCISVDNPTNLYLCGDKYTITHNSTLSAPFIMSKGILIGGHNSYILSNVSAQSQDTFMKIEQIAKKEIASFSGLTDFFMGELVKSAANTDGFTHSQTGFYYKLFNGSSVKSLSGNITNNRGKRSSLNVYDESGWTEEDYVVATTPFLLQNSTFRLGGDMDVTTFPQQIPNQRLFISSASSTDSYYYTLYKDYAKRMFMGDKNYFVCDLNCEIMINATYNGKLYPVPLINKDEIDAEMRKNKEKALREFFNKFSVDGGDNQPFKRAMIVRNSEVRLPVLKNEEQGKRKFLIAYDPAHEYNNSVCMVAELINDKDIGEKLNICGGISFVDIGKKKKTPMRTPEQIALLKLMILDYNGKGNPDYENIEQILIDSGAGGHGTTIADYLMEDWNDSEGRKHKGFIDKEECKDHISKFPNAVNILKLLSPQKYKKEMFDALLEMINLDLISFTGEYDSKGYLQIPSLTGKMVDIEDDNGNIVQENEIVYKRVKLDFEEELVLKNIDLAKEELIYTYRYKNGDNYRYDTSKEKVNDISFDRAYCLAMLGWYLQQVRRKHITGKKKNTNISPSSYFAIANKSSRARR